jgi:outer membrane protein assembly factor BamB
MSDRPPSFPSADRGPPPTVPAVQRDGVRYEQNLRASEAEFGQVGGVLSARDSSSGKVLWSLKVYPNTRQPGLEGDVQDVFFSSMAFDAHGRLVIENENGARFAVDIVQRTVTALP